MIVETEIAVPQGGTIVVLNDRYSQGDAPDIRVRNAIEVEDNRRIGTGQSIAVMNTGYGRMIVSSTDPYQGSWLQNIGVSPEDEDICDVRDLLAERPRGTFIDIGASFGCWSLALAADVDKVIAIEPQRAIFNMLCGSVVLNGLTRRVFPRHGAIGRKRGQAPILTVDPEACNNFGCVSLNAQVPADIDPRFTESVEVWALRDIIDPDERIAFLKIDVEGFEWAVLMGALELIARWKPIMFIEWGLSDETKLGTQIEALGYVLEYRCGNWLCLPVM